VPPYVLHLLAGLWFIGSMASPHVLLLHGYQHERPKGHWLWWLHDELTERGIDVRYPQLPRPHDPVLADWISAATSELALLADGDRVVVTHSLGGILWMHLRDQGLATADRVLMVAPPSRDRLGRELAGFDIEIDPTGVTVMGRETDPYRSVGLEEYSAGRADAVVTIPGDGHINLDDGHGPFPRALVWVLGGAAP
jgi:predicted alpha/beta hydrolase family esterase